MFEPLILSTKNLLNSDHINNLLNGKVSCIIIEDFYSPDSCKVLAEYLQSKPNLFKTYNNIDAKVLGNPLFWDGNTFNQYLDASEICKNQVYNIYRNLKIENPLELVINTFNFIWSSGAVIPSEGSKSFYAGDIRIINNAGLHTDVVTRNIKSGVLGQIKKQMSWNIYLTEPGNTFGALEIFDKEFSETDRILKQKNGFGYKKQIVQNCSKYAILPKLGRFVLFKSSNYHKIKKNPDRNCPRITVTSFIGFISKRRPLIFWS